MFRADLGLVTEHVRVLLSSPEGGPLHADRLILSGSPSPLPYLLRRVRQLALQLQRVAHVQLERLEVRLQSHHAQLLDALLLSGNNKNIEYTY